VASQRVGAASSRNCGLRDDRFVQRYLQAVEEGQAHGWHTLVYGVTLAVYSLPLRQGLIAYAHQTTRSFIYSAARTLQLSERACRAIFEDTNAGLPEAVKA
jgi:urease accessory protein UreF